jgi:hypothetical protein
MRARPPRRKPDKLLRLGMELKANAGHRAQDRITPKQRAREPERTTSIDPLAVPITVRLRGRLASRCAGGSAQRDPLLAAPIPREQQSDGALI